MAQTYGREMKMISEIVGLFLFGVYSYLQLVFRKFFPRTPKSLDGEVFLITGSGSGIGKAVGEYLALHHPQTKLVLWDCNEKGNNEMAEFAKGLGVEVFQYKVDVTDRKQVNETAVKMLEEVGPVTILFNNAGVLTVSDVLTTPPEKIEKLISVNLTSHFWTIQAFLPSMINFNRGHIVTTSSAAAYMPMRGGASYSATKHAIRGYLESLRSELRHHPLKPDIKFTTVFPYFVQTNMTSGITVQTKVPVDHLDPKYTAAKIVDAIRRDKEKLFLPESFEVLFFLNNFTPASLYRKIEDFLFEKIESENK